MITLYMNKDFERRSTKYLIEITDGAFVKCPLSPSDMEAINHFDSEGSASGKLIALAVLVKRLEDAEGAFASAMNAEMAIARRLGVGP